MNCKRKGTKNEHRSAQLLESQGYQVTRSSASLGVFDIIGVGPSDIVLVQVKTNRNPGAVELDAIRSFKAPSNCRRIIHVWKDREAEPDIREIGQGADRKKRVAGNLAQKRGIIRA